LRAHTKEPDGQLDLGNYELSALPTSLQVHEEDHQAFRVRVASDEAAARQTSVALSADPDSDRLEHVTDSAPNDRVQQSLR
jgi:hypothetical protein